MLDRGTASWALWGWWFVRSRVVVQWGRILAGRFESQESYASCWCHHIYRQMCARVGCSTVSNATTLAQITSCLTACTIRRSAVPPPSNLPHCWQGPLSRRSTPYASPCFPVTQTALCYFLLVKMQFHFSSVQVVPGRSGWVLKTEKTKHQRKFLSKAAKVGKKRDILLSENRSVNNKTLEYILVNSTCAVLWPAEISA